MDPAVPFRPYLKAWFASAAGFCLLAGAINLAVDPYGLFGTPRITGLTALKPSAPDRIVFTKPYYAARAAPRTLIVGNSRPEAGLDPASPCWDPSQRPVFNNAIPGASFPDQIRYATHAAADGRLSAVFIGLDYLDFLINPAAKPNYAAWPGPPTALDERLRRRLDGTPNPHYGWHRLQDWLTGVFSLASLADSITTLLRQHEADVPTRQADGFNPGRDYRPIIHAEGQYVLFAQKNREIVKLLQRPNQAIFQGTGDWSWNFETLERYLARAQGEGIAVTLFINPYHADYLAAIGLTGHWPRLEAWKRTLTVIADRHGVPLWDFNAFDPASQEPSPPPGERTSELRWFWEPSHYRPEYGERMLAAMLGADCGPDAAATGTGLTGARLEDHLAQLRLGLAAFLKNDPDSIKDLVFSRSTHNMQ